MKKPIVVIPSVTPKNQKLDKFGGWDWMDISNQVGVTTVFWWGRC